MPVSSIGCPRSEDTAIAVLFPPVCEKRDNTASHQQLKCLLRLRCSFGLALMQCCNSLLSPRKQDVTTQVKLEVLYVFGMGSPTGEGPAQMTPTVAKQQPTGPL